jgi:hypothetical protein
LREWSCQSSCWWEFPSMPASDAIAQLGLVRNSMHIDRRPGRRRLLMVANDQPGRRRTGHLEAVSSDPWSRAVVWSVNAALERDEPVLAAELARQSRPAAA